MGSTVAPVFTIEDEEKQPKFEIADASTTAPEQPGFGQRLRESLGIPSWEQAVAQGQEAAAHPIRSTLESLPPVQAAQGIYDWGKRTAKNMGEGVSEEKEAIQNIREGGPILPNVGKFGYGIAHGGIGSLPFIGSPMETAAQDVVNKNYAGAAGGLTGVAGMVAAPELIKRTPAATEALGKVPGTVGTALRTERGAIRPGVATLGRVGGTVLGTAAGHLTGIPGAAEAGGVAGALGGRALIDALVPKRPNIFSPEIDPVALAVRNRTASWIPTKIPKAPLAESPRIVSPIEGEPRFSGSEGRPATWTNEDVMRLAQQGNREAIQQVIRRGLELPPNARYVMGSPDYPRGVYNPRETTIFSPEGTAIRNRGNPLAKNPSSKARIQGSQ